MEFAVFKFCTIDSTWISSLHGSGKFFLDTCYVRDHLHVGWAEVETMWRSVLETTYKTKNQNYFTWVFALSTSNAQHILFAPETVPNLPGLWVKMSRGGFHYSSLSHKVEFETRGPVSAVTGCGSEQDGRGIVGQPWPYAQTRWLSHSHTAWIWKFQPWRK